MNLRESSACETCNEGIDESVEHIMFECQAYEHIRNGHFGEICQHTQSNLPGLDFTELSPFNKLQFLIGDVAYCFNQDSGVFFDRIGKNMLKKIFNLRSEILCI